MKPIIFVTLLFCTYAHASGKLQKPGSQNVDRCSLPIEPGPGKALLPMYAFDGNNCVPFSYGGLGGNANRFSTEAECLRVCSGQNRQQTVQPRPEQPRLYDDRCHLPIEPGPGMALLPMYAFDGNNCVPFNYGGLEGNANRFFTEAECLRVCSGQNRRQTARPRPEQPRLNDVPERCTLPMDQGIGRASIPMFAFDGSNCVPLLYGGTGGNANRFFKKEDCETQCKRT